MDKTYELKLTGNEINLLFEALQELPYKRVAAVIGNINQQVIAQQKPVEEEKADGE